MSTVEYLHGHLWNEDLQCGLDAIVFDYNDRRVLLRVPEMHRTSMDGAITLCQSFFPEVAWIEVQCGDKEYYHYILRKGEWKITEIKKLSSSA
jgi:hypothetical protein